MDDTLAPSLIGTSGSAAAAAYGACPASPDFTSPGAAA